MSIDKLKLEVKNKVWENSIFLRRRRISEKFYLGKIEEIILSRIKPG